jgi:hypothetical protein
MVHFRENIPDDGIARWFNSIFLHKSHACQLLEADDFVLIVYFFGSVHAMKTIIIPPFDSVKQYQLIPHNSLSLPTL